MRHIALAILLSIATSLSAIAQDGESLSPSAMEQIILSEKLIATGTVRNDPLLILAAIRIRSAIEEPIAGHSDTLTTREEAFAAARQAARGKPAILTLIDDVEVERSRRMCIYARNGVCY